MDDPGAANPVAGMTLAAGPILEARGVVFRHPENGAPLFDGLSFAVGPGEFVGLLGPNGAGKTTLLRLLAGLIAPGAGVIVLSGRPLAGYRPRDRARLLATVPQENSLLFEFSVLEVVLMGRAPHLGALALEGPDDLAAAREALAQVEIEPLADRPLSALSSGERQRALIARALAQRPRVLLLDEPTAFLDLKHRLQIYEILRRLGVESGLAVVAVSHDLNLAARYGTRLVVLDRGRVVADGDPATLVTPDLLRAVYETDAMVGRDPETGAVFVVPRTPVAR
jgi:iron complex transport system ATP-binding protein